MKTLTLGLLALTISGIVEAGCEGQILQHYHKIMDTSWTQVVRGKIEGNILESKVKIWPEGSQGTLFSFGVAPVKIRKVGESTTHAIHKIDIEKKIKIEETYFNVTLIYTVGNHFDAKCVRIPDQADQVIDGITDNTFKEAVLSHQDYIATSNVVDFKLNGFENDKKMAEVVEKKLKSLGKVYSADERKFNYLMDISLAKKTASSCELNGKLTYQQHVVGNSAAMTAEEGVKLKAPTCVLAVKKMVKKLTRS